MKKHVAAIYLVPILAFVFCYSCTSPIDKIKNRIWKGQLYRSSDDKKLSEAVFKMSNDTLYLYANAIFGAENDTLLYEKYDANDSVYTYRNALGESIHFYLKLETEDKVSKLLLAGSDYYIVLQESNINLQETLAFYLNIDVPYNAYMYLDGAYEGEVEMENQFANLFLSEIGGASVKIVFIDNFKVKVYLKSLFVDMFSESTKPTYEIVDYKINGTKLILNRNKAKAQTIEVKNNGETLVLATDKLNVVMHKSY